MGMKSKRKGRIGEQEVARILRSYGYDAHRGVQYQGGQDSPDVVGLPGVHIEVKRTESFRLWDALSQAKGDCGGNKPVVMHRKNDCEWVVIQPLTDWIEFYKNWEVNQNE